jgi:hypothetical protein
VNFMTRDFVLAGLLSLALSPVMAQQPGGLFDGADGNGDGAVSREEFLAARAGQFARRDRNQDGYIDAVDDERAAARPRLATGLAKARDRMDRSGDGKVSKEEFVNGALPLFERADVNADGTLDAKEVAAAKAAISRRGSR